MGFEAHDRHIYELFNRSQYLIPRNQRRYVWTKRNWQELLDDVMLVLNGTEPAHFIGSMVLYTDKDRENGISRYTIIDGQQRIITLTILLTSIAFWLKCYEAEDEFNGTKQYIVARDDSDKDHIMVMPEHHVSLSRILDGVLRFSYEDLKQYQIEAFLNRCAPGNRDRNIKAAFKFYLEAVGNAVSASRKKPLNYLVGLRDAIVNKILYVSIIASSEEDACTIFEILNARGSALEDHELLKNYIMRGITPDGDVDTAKAIWCDIENDLGPNIGRFVKHYATHRYRTSTQDGPSDYKTIQAANKGLSTQELLDDIRLKATYYCKLTNPILTGENANCSKTEFMVYSFFKKKRHEQIRPVLLSLIHQEELNALSTEKYEEAILFLYDFIVCYNIIGQENSNKITNIVYAMAKGLENEYSDKLLQEFIEDLNGKLPGEDTFCTLFSQVGWSHHGGFYDDDKDKERVRVVLEVLERSKSASRTCGDFTIEHILDDQDDACNGRIGNLIPLEESLNSQCNGKSFKEKLQIYAQSSFYTARSIAKRYENTEIFDIDSRTRAIAKEFYGKILAFKIASVSDRKPKMPLRREANEKSILNYTVREIVESKKIGKKVDTLPKEEQLSLFDLIQ